MTEVLFSERSLPMQRAHPFFQFLDLALLFLKLLFELFLLSSLLLLFLLQQLLLFRDLRLLFSDGVDENGRELLVLDTFNFAFVVTRYEKRFNLRDILRSEADIAHSAVFPIESYRAQTTDDVQSAREGLHGIFVTQAR